MNKYILDIIVLLIPFIVLIAIGFKLSMRGIIAVKFFDQFDKIQQLLEKNAEKEVIKSELEKIKKTIEILLQIT